jgi:hypothetical protein
LILDRAPFFTTALSEPWAESQSKEISIYPDKIDSSVTQGAFELAIKKLYGYDITKECDAEAIGLFATGCWLEMQDLVDAAIDSILRQMTPETLAPLIRLMTCNYYGRSGDRILESAKAMLSRSGWEMPLRCWDGMPGEIIRELVGSDGFFVYSEWDRWVLAKRLLDRRLRQAAAEAGLIDHGKSPLPKAPDSLRLMAVRFDSVYRRNAVTVGQGTWDRHAPWLALYTNPDIESLLVLLDEGIHYLHMEYEQLEYIRNARDIFGLPVLPDNVVSNALWQQLSLRHKVLTAAEADQELGLCQTPPDPAIAITEPSSNEKQTVDTTDLDADSDVETETWDGNGKPRKFWIPSSDCNIVLGNGADPVVTTSNSFQRHASRLSATMQPEDAQWATDFASSPATMSNPNTRTDNPGRPITAGGSNAGQPRPISYTELPPFRFSAEFPNPRNLKEKKRVYSRTVSYAGSLWNIYIQKVRTNKNVQLGVYLHRAKEREVNEQAQGSGLSQQHIGSVDERIGQLERGMLRGEHRQRRSSTRNQLFGQRGEEDVSGSGSDGDATFMTTGSQNPLFPSSGLGLHRSGLGSSQSRWSASTHVASPLPNSGNVRSHPFETNSALDDGSSDSDEDEPASAYPNPSLLSLLLPRSREAPSTLPPYVDRRPTIKTYFKIYSPSKGGRVLSIYESAPDRFNFSQSWGWKSSTLMLDENTLSAGGNSGGDEVITSDPTSDVRKRNEGNLRFMVVIGNL